jgi:hypothetical protein
MVTGDLGSPGESGAHAAQVVERVHAPRPESAIVTTLLQSMTERSAKGIDCSNKTKSALSCDIVQVIFHPFLSVGNN